MSERQVHIAWRPVETGSFSYWSYRKAWWRAFWMGFTAPWKATPIVLSFSESLVRESMPSSLPKDPRP